jgi:hypothetical protein
VVQQEHRIELWSPFFVFRLDTVAGLRAESWENRLTGRTLALGNGPELEFDIGLPDSPLRMPRLQVTNVEIRDQGEAAELVVRLNAREPAAAVQVAYRWNANDPVLRKFVTITSGGNTSWERLLNVRLGSYDTAGAPVADTPAGGTYSVPAPRVFPLSGSTHVERGFPAYAADEFFFTLAHPAGAAEGAGGKVLLRQYPGARLAPGETFACMEVVYGVAKTGEARAVFIDHVRSRMRRVARGHDRPYAIFDNFGAWPGGNFLNTEAYVLHSLDRLAASRKAAGVHFDLCSVDFWVDYCGTLKECDPQRFPNGLAPIRQKLDALETAMGLWIDGSWEGWSIGGNPRPDVQACLNYDLQKPDTLNDVQLGRKAFCRATEPIRSMYAEAFCQHIRQHGVRLLKFDNTSTICVNPAHDHLPGLYSTEAIADGLIDFFRALDAECPDVFLMLYWGYKSPWWLLHGDTLFDSGIDIEAASPSDQPAPYARDSVTQKLDQAQRFTADIPPLGKDSLGVWLSDWGWNSSIGKERWQGGLVMDLCRGSLLAQIWADNDWLSPPEWTQLADFLALLKARPECFGNPRFILGDPRKDEPYGYCCTDGRRAFLAIHNGVWRDSALTLELSSAWGLPDGKRWDVYRWWPDPARLGGAHGSGATIALRPFDIVLLEVVPEGEPPTLSRTFEPQAMPTWFAEDSCDLSLTVAKPGESTESDVVTWTSLEPVEFRSTGGATLTKLADGSLLAGGENPAQDSYVIQAPAPLGEITAIRLETLPHESLPHQGPGRAVNGNFTLAEFTLTAAGQPVRMARADAGFAQTSYGGWPAAAAIDGQPQTGWGIDPAEGLRHVAVFELAQPRVCAPGTALEFRLDHADRQHSIGRLRLSATSAQLPISVPASQPRFLVRGSLPPTKSGGIMVVTVVMKNGSDSVRFANVGTHFSWEGKLAGEIARFQPVLGTATYPSCWQAWRLEVAPSAQLRPFELAITANVAPDVQLVPAGYFVPGTGCATRER